MTPSTGDLWFDATTSTSYVWDGADWELVVPVLPDGSLVLVVDGSLSATDAADVRLLRAYRDQMTATAERWAAARGYRIVRGGWEVESASPSGHGLAELIRLECYLSPVTDGVWGEIHAARSQDAADQAVAASEPIPARLPAEGPLVVHVAPDGP